MNLYWNVCIIKLNKREMWKRISLWARSSLISRGFHHDFRMVYFSLLNLYLTLTSSFYFCQCGALNYTAKIIKAYFRLSLISLKLFICIFCEKSMHENSSSLEQSHTKSIHHQSTNLYFNDASWTKQNKVSNNNNSVDFISIKNNWNFNVFQRIFWRNIFRKLWWNFSSCRRTTESKKLLALKCFQFFPAVAIWAHKTSFS